MLLQVQVLVVVHVLALARVLVRVFVATLVRVLVLVLALVLVVLVLTLALVPGFMMMLVAACRFSLRRSQEKQLRLMLNAAIAFGKRRWRLRARQACLRSWCV